MQEFIWPVRVYYEDTDVGGVVFHANYLKYFERARTEFLRDLGFDLLELQLADRILFVVRRMQIDFLKPARFNDLLSVSARVTEMKKASFTCLQQARCGEELLCDASVKLACIDADSFFPKPIPVKILDQLR